MVDGQCRHCVLPSCSGGLGLGHGELSRWGYPVHGFAPGSGTASCFLFVPGSSHGVLPSLVSKGQLQSLRMLQPGQLLPCADGTSCPIVPAPGTPRSHCPFSRVVLTHRFAILCLLITPRDCHYSFQDYCNPKSLL